MDCWPLLPAIRRVLFVTCPGEVWTDVLVYETLTNPAYIGQGPAPDILQDIEAWELAQGRLRKS